MKIENIEQLRSSQETLDSYRLQRANDLLEQVERLKEIDAKNDPRLQIEVSMGLIALYETLHKFL